MDFNQVPYPQPRDHIDYQPLPDLHVPKKKLKLFSWNAGGLSSERYWELLRWIDGQQFDVAIVQESRWAHDGEWQLPRWSVIHTASDK